MNANEIKLTINNSNIKKLTKMIETPIDHHDESNYQASVIGLTIQTRIE